MRLKHSLLFLIIIVVFSGCSSSKMESSSTSDSSSYAPASPHNEESYKFSESSGYVSNSKTEVSEDEYSPSESAYSNDSENVDYDSTQTVRKIVKTGNLSLMVSDFGLTVFSIKAITTTYGGYIASSEIDGSANYDYARSYGSFTLKIPAEHYEEAKDEILGLGELVSYNDSTEDFTSEYFDTKSRLNSKLAEEKRLLELLEKAETLEDILKIESKLSSVRTTIEIYQSSLNTIDDKVAFSTLHIRISNEPIVYDTEPEATFIERVSGGFSSSVKGMISFLQSLIIAVSYLSVPIVSLLIIGFISFAVYKKFKKPN